MSERRFYLRVPLELPVVVSGRRRVPARATGISCGGMTVVARGLQAGETVSVAMSLPGSSHPTVVDARVAHVVGEIAGLAFTTVGPADAEAIEQIVWATLCPTPGAPGPSPRPAEAAAAPSSSSFRVPLDVPVTLGRHSGAVEARATGMTPGGIAVRGVALEPGEQLTVELQLPGAPGPIRAPGVVARVGRSIAGIRFVGLRGGELQDLERTLWSYLRAAVRGGAPAAAGQGARRRADPDRTESILVAIDTATGRAAPDGTARGCEIPGCDRPHKARGLCALHYNRWRKRA